MSEVGLAKGSLLVTTRDFVTEREGPALWADLMRALPEGDRQVLGGLVLVGGWYPVAVWNRLMDELQHRRDARYLLRLARYIADNDISLFFRIALKLGTPEFVIKRLGWLFKQYFRGAQMKTAPTGPRRWTIRIEGGVGIEEAPGEAVCTVGTEGWVYTAMERTGVRTSCLVKVDCRFHGAQACTYDLTW
jgi:hypothetical protein